MTRVKRIGSLVLLPLTIGLVGTHASCSDENGDCAVAHVLPQLICECGYEPDPGACGCRPKPGGCVVEPRPDGAGGNPNIMPDASPDGETE